MKRGDIILYSGKGIMSWLIKKVTGSKWSHVAWILDNETILESDASTGGVVKSPLSKYINPTNDLEGRFKIVKIKQISKNQLNSALMSAIEKIGNKYDYVSIASLAWRYFLGLFGIKSPVSLEKGNRDTCVELIAMPLFLHARWKCFENKNIHETTPGDFDLTEHTQEVT